MSKYQTLHVCFYSANAFQKHNVSQNTHEHNCRNLVSELLYFCPGLFLKPCRVQQLRWSAGRSICCVTKTWPLLCPLTHSFSLPMPVRVCACVWLLSLIWKQLTPLSCYAGCNPNQTKALSLPLSLSLSNPPIKTVPSFNLSSPSSFVTLSIISFFFHFTLLSFHSSPFSKLFENITFPPSGSALSPPLWNLFI